MLHKCLLTCPVEWMVERNGRTINQSNKASLQRRVAGPQSWEPAESTVRDMEGH